MTSTADNRNLYFPIDCTKMLLAVLIVLLHSQPLTDNKVAATIFERIFQSAVPLFFIFSGFFYAKKRKAGATIKRILKLYLFWLIPSLPLAIFMMKDLSLLQGVERLLFQATYSVSWYLTAIVWSVVIVTLFAKIKNHKIAWGGVTLLSIVIYILSIKDFNSFPWLNTPLMESVCQAWRAVFFSVSWTFAQGLIFFVIGMAFSDGLLPRRRSVYAIVTAIGIVLYAIEAGYVLHIGTPMAAPAFTLPILTTGIMGLCLSWCRPTDTAATGRTLRMASTFLYLSHPVVMWVAGFTLHIYGGWPRLWLTLAGCSVAFLVWWQLRNRRGFRWLKYAC